MVNEELNEELKLILFEEFGLSLNNSEVCSIAKFLIGFFDILVGIESEES